MSRHIALAGMMGTGKSTVGDLVAARLGRDLIDTDAAVEAAARKDIARIFEEDGEPRFRSLERVAVSEACARPAAVIALGGGAILDPGSVALLAERAFTVLLDAPIEALAQRVVGGSARPLLTGDVVGQLTRLRDERGPAYTEVAAERIEATAPPAEVAMAVLSAAARRGDVLTATERAALP